MGTPIRMGLSCCLHSRQNSSAWGLIIWLQQANPTGSSTNLLHGLSTEQLQQLAQAISMISSTQSLTWALYRATPTTSTSYFYVFTKP